MPDGHNVSFLRNSKLLFTENNLKIKNRYFPLFLSFFLKKIGIRGFPAKL